MVERDKTILSIQNRINESRNKNGIAVTIALSTLRDVYALLKEKQDEIIPYIDIDEAKCPDCFGTIGGEAEIDNCGECTGGETGIEKNSTCQQDCIGYWNGSAFLDNCGICVGGTTGGTPCAETILTDIINGNDASIKKIEVYDLLGRTKKIITKEELKNLTHKNNNQLLILKIIKQTTIEVVKFYK